MKHPRTLLCVGRIWHPFDLVTMFVTFSWYVHVATVVFQENGPDVVHEQLRGGWREVDLATYGGTYEIHSPPFAPGWERRLAEYKNRKAPYDFEASGIAGLLEHYGIRLKKVVINAFRINCPEAETGVRTGIEESTATPKSIARDVKR